MGCFSKKRKRFQCTIVLLDETEIIEEIEPRTRGQDILDRVYKHLNLLETAYFGLRYLNKTGESRWLDPSLKVSKQLKGLSPYTLYFGVKFYASDPCKLLEEITRYQFVLQLKQDILQGRLPVNDDLAAELFALSLQGELGDYDPRKHHKLYVSEFRFLPDQSSQLEDKVEEIHKTLVGQVPSAVEMTFLERVKWLDMYGVDVHPVMGEDQIEYYLCLTPSGVVVMKNKNKISNYFWPRISKVFFKGKYFMIRVRDKTNDENTYSFALPSKEACEYLWRCCVEHHAFFRLTQVKDISGNPLHFFKLGSKYRYSGRTEQQIRNDMKQIHRPPPPIVRVPSRRYQKRIGEPDGADADIKEKEIYKNTIMMDIKDDLALRTSSCSAPLYRSVSTPAVLSALEQQLNLLDPAPWENPNHGGLFSSRQSIASSRGSDRRSNHRHHHHRRSNSIESHNSNDSRRRRHHRSKKGSDNESDISKSSRGSRGSKSSRKGSHHRKSRCHSIESGSDSDSYHKSRRKHSSRKSGSNYNLVDSETQWKMVQRKQKEKDNLSPQSAVVRDLSSRKSGYMNSGVDTESEAPTNHRKKHRRHSRSRSRSRSPEINPVISSEIKKHIEYHLVDSTNLTEEEKKDIKYTKVESENNVYRIRYSPGSGRPKYKVAKVSSRSSLDRISKKSMLEDPPPPYTPTHAILNDSNTRNQWEREASSSTISYPIRNSTNKKLVNGYSSSNHRKRSESSKRNSQNCSSSSQENQKLERNRHQKKKKLDGALKSSKRNNEISTEL